jgi:hypothetical protein
MLGHFPFTLPQDLTTGTRRQLRELGQAAERTFLFHYYREANTRTEASRRSCAPEAAR